MKSRFRPLFALTAGLLLAGAGASRVCAAAAQPPLHGTAPADTALLQAYLPKEDLGVTRFLREHPSADGRGVIVAILDTGIDLNHPGLLRTPEGTRKILDVFDATDNGLIELPLEIASTDSVLTGLTGRTLRLGSLRAEDGRYRLGRLAAREVFPRGLTRRLLDDRREDRRKSIDRWEERVAEEEAAVSREREDTTAALRERSRAYRKVRREADRAFADPGPAYDVLACRRGGVWELRIDVDEDGDLGEETPLQPYGAGGDLVLFPPPATLSAALSWIADDGSRCSLVFDEGGHGTHVAGIVGAYYGPNDPLNGLAPGVQFLAVRIGNSKMGGSTSHNSIAKGITWAVAHGASVANISFGGTSHFGDGKEILSRYLDEVVQNRGMFITLSAGNEGPGLSTVGSPGTARRVFTLGAAISPLTMMASYGGLPQAELPRGIRLFNFSSRGPLTNGSPGIDFISPGAAVSTLPTWHLTRNENWHGTSMAAPQAAGCITLLLSAARQDDVPASPPRVDRALRATAVPLPGVSFVEQGAGLISLPEAYDALRALARVFPVEPAFARAGGRSSPGSAADSAVVPNVGVPATRDPVCFWRLSVENATGEGEGYYERNEQQTAPYWKSWYVAPDLPERSANPLRTRFQRVVRLSPDVPWLLAPPQVAIPASGTWIRVQVDPTKMQPGLNAGRIRLQTVATGGADGALVPVTAAPGSETDLTAVVVRPEAVTAPDWRWERTMTLAPGDRQGAFLRVPAGATRMTIRLRETAAEPENAYAVAVTALDVLHPPSALRDERGVDLRAGEEITLYQRVEGGATLELAVFARWVNALRGSLEVTVEFDGVTGPEGSGSTARLWGEQNPEARWGETPLVVPPGEDGVRLPLRSALRPTTVRLSASFHSRVEPLEVDWVTRPDTLHPATLEGDRDPLLQFGRAWVRLDRGEAVGIDLHASPELEDFLDDAFCRMFTPTGSLIAAAGISSGPFRLTAPEDGPPSGWYRLEFSIFAVGRDLVKDARFLSPEVLRGESRGRVTPFPDPVSGRAASADSSWSVSLPAGASRPVFLRVTGLPENSIWAGTLTARDADNRPPLLSVPLRADARTQTPSAEDALDASLEALEREARRLLSLSPGAPAAAVRAALAELGRADALEKAWKSDGLEGSDGWWSRLFLRLDLYLRHALAADPATGRAPAAEAGDRDGDRAADARREDAQRETGRLLGEADRQLRGELREPEARRRAGRAQVRRAAYEIARGDYGAAHEAYERSRTYGFGGDDDNAVRASILLHEKKPLEALDPLRRACRKDPWNADLARKEIGLYLDLGWVDLADEAIASWADRFPGERATLLDAAVRRAAVTAAAEARAGR